MDFERQKPVTDEYRENFDVVFRATPPTKGQLATLGALASGAQRIVIASTYPNGCPILTEECVDG